jgi:hypothetical protein
MWLSNSRPLSERICNGVPKMAKILSNKTFDTDSASWCRIGYANANLVNRSTAVKIYANPFRLLGCGPVISIASRSKGSPTGARCNRPFFRRVSAVITGACFAPPDEQENVPAPIWPVSGGLQVVLGAPYPGVINLKRVMC